MKYAIQINASPYQSNRAENAYQFVQTVLELRHEVLRIFFYKEGVYHAFRYTCPPDDEVNPVKRWSDLAEKYNVDLVVCISAAQRRGLLDPMEAKRQGQAGNNVADGFRIAGLGLWVEAMLEADRFLEFG
jgi:tRNA 2-thiouridine synthesizing protein D